MGEDHRHLVVRVVWEAVLEDNGGPLLQDQPTRVSCVHRKSHRLHGQRQAHLEGLLNLHRFPVDNSSSSQ